APVKPLAAIAFIAEIATDQTQVGADRLCVLDQPLRRLWIAADRRPAGTVDMRLLPPDLLARVAQIVDVIHIDAGDDRAVRIEDIDRIQPPAQSHFEDERIEARTRERHPG